MFHEIHKSGELVLFCSTRDGRWHSMIEIEDMFPKKEYIPRVRFYGPGYDRIEDLIDMMDYYFPVAMHIGFKIRRSMDPDPGCIIVERGAESTGK